MEVVFLDSYNKGKNDYAVCLGSFDGIHIGHKRLMARTVEIAKEKGLKSGAVIILPPVEKNKLFPMEENLRRIEKTGIDTVFIIKFTEEFKKLSPKAFADKYLDEIICAKYVICGFNFRFGHNREGTPEALRELGKGIFELTVIDRVFIEDKTVSSSYIKSLLEEGKIERVNALLGECYLISDTVKKGKQLGRSIEVPTVNLKLSPELSLIKKGVYSSVSEIDGENFESISYIGNAPTVGDFGELVLETHILDYKGDLYEKKVTVKLVGFIREEKKFSSLNELKEEIKANIITAKKQISECEYI